MRVRRTSRIRRFALRALVLVAIGLPIVLWLLMSSAPGWYDPPDPNDERVIARADRAEYHVAEAVHKVRPPEQRWTIRIPEADCNAWLAARLQRWIAHEQSIEWPTDIGTPQLRFERDGVSLAVPVSEDAAAESSDETGSTGWASGVVVVRAMPAILDGRLQLHVDRVALGRLTLPGQPVARLLEAIDSRVPGESSGSQGSEESVRWLDVLAGSQTLDPVFTLSDGRRIRVTAIKLDQGLVDLTAVTLPSDQVRNH